MRTFDIDGTLLNYDAEKGQNPSLNVTLLDTLRPGERIALVTNQGGLPFGLMDETGEGKFPTPVEFVWRLTALINALTERGVTVAGVHVCTYHPKAPMSQCAEAAAAIMHLLNYSPLVSVYATEEWRKPNPAMLAEAGATVYYGDSTEDEAAAANAGIPFVKVQRFTSAGGGHIFETVTCATCGRQDKAINADGSRYCPECGRTVIFKVAAWPNCPADDSSVWVEAEAEWGTEPEEVARQFIEGSEAVYLNDVVQVWVKQGHTLARCFDVYAERVVTYFAVERDTCPTHDEPLPCAVCQGILAPIRELAKI